MFCPKCKTRDIPQGNYCHKCGARLKAGAGNSSVLARWLLIALFLILGTALMVRFLSFKESPGGTKQGQDVAADKNTPSSTLSSEVEKGEVIGQHVENKFQKDASINPDPHELRSSMPQQVKKETGEAKSPMVGEVKIYDSRANEIASIVSGILSGGLVALPRRACLGGADWSFFPYGHSMESGIVDGLWNEGDDIGLWRIEGNAEDKITLGTWDSSLPLSWLSLQTGVMVADVAARPEWNQGDILPMAIPEALSAPGIFIQQDMVVGWTFGDWLPGGYLWNRSVPSSNDFRSTVDRFYSVTFAGGREEQFAKAILMDAGTSAGERLQAFLAGVSLPPKLAKSDTPEQLYFENVMTDIRYLAQLLRHHGEAEQLADLIDGKVIDDTRDIELLKNTVSAIAEIGDYGRAVQFLENTKGYFADEYGGNEVRAMQLYLYKNWLISLLVQKDTYTGWGVFNSGAEIFPEDPELHLFGVELALLDENWVRAEEMLYQREYPMGFRQRVALLADRISDLKGQDGKIVIRFSAGSTRIPVVATVNNRQDINFLVDTGATMVTVPIALLDNLGIEISANTSRRMVATAGGLTEAWVVNLSSIELGGWVVYDLEALAIDIPSHNHIGLLGLNFLEKFRMDLNTEKGILLLEPL